MVKAGRCLAVFSFALVLAGFASPSQRVTPSTTLSVEKGNNTSTADGFQAQSNGNAAAGNVSKVNMRELLYPGATTSIYAHYMPWFGSPKHMNIGYSSADALQVAKQVEDMASRGIQGVIIDWYGANSALADTSTTLIMKEAEKRPGFKFAVTEDAGAVRDLPDPTSALISDLIYAWQKYEQSSAYLYISGRPVVFFFGLEKIAIDWNAVRAQVPGNPVFVFQNTGSFADPIADAAFSWVGSFGDPNNWGQDYLAFFYDTGLKSNKHIVGSVKKGFNDTLAAWTKNRIINQNCGQTWLSTFSEIGKHFSATKQLELLQIVTWNDYEEGTAVEMGIDNCVSVDGSASGGKITWSVAGQENTIHHYTLFISSDGENLMKVADLPAGTREFDLGTLAFEPGSYSVFVKAVGQPSIRNQISGAISYTVATPAPATADLQLSATPGVISVTRGGSATADLVLTPTGDFNRVVSLSCMNLPAGVTCSFDKTSLTPGSTPATVKMTLSAQSTSARFFGTTAVFALSLPGLGMVFAGGRRLPRKKSVALLTMALLLLLGAVGCGGITEPLSQQKQASKAGSYTFSIVAQADTFQRSVNATVALQ